MQKIGTISTRQDADQFSYLLNRQGIENTISQTGQVYEVWIKHDKHIPLAQQTLSSLADEQDPIVHKIPPGKLTLVFLAICIGIYLVFHVGFSDIYLWLMMSETRLGIEEIQNGQLWRLLTPIFLHSPLYVSDIGNIQPINIIHILFNLLWLYELGSLIETNESALRLFLLVLVIGVVSNFIQYLAGDTRFFGMSGVIYGLLGYLWYLSHYAQDKTGYHVNRIIMLIMIAWLVICYTGWVGNIANAAHLSGLICGVILGFLAEKAWPEHEH